jgi:proteasome lid subunit RPN8/RPN11
MSEELQLEIEEHAYSDLSFEVGGMLFGNATSRSTEILGHVPALKAEKEQVSLTFTHEVWEEIIKEGEAKFPGYKIVGWYHTHPSFGIFLSDYDAFIQQNFFSAKGHLALVVDPIAGSLGWFDLDAKGSIRRLGIEQTIRGPRRRPAAPQDPGFSFSRQRGKSLLLALPLISALVGGLIGFGIATGNAPTDLSDALETRDEMIASLSSTLSTTEQKLSDFQRLQQNLLSSEGFVFAVETKISVTELAKTLFLDEAAIDAIISLNPGVSLESLFTPGDLIFLPSKPWLELKPSASLLPPDSESRTIKPPTGSFTLDEDNSSKEP